MIRVACMGVKCPVKNTCKRYTEFSENITCELDCEVIQRCTNQKKFLQDESKVVQRKYR